MLALHQELGCDISGWLDFTGLFILLVELFNSFLGGHHLKEKGKEKERGKEVKRVRGRKLCVMMVDEGNRCV